VAKGETMREGSKPAKPRRPTLTNKVVRGLDVIVKDAERGVCSSGDEDVPHGTEYLKKLIAWHDSRQK